jgi:hypothetical protein
MRLSRHARNEMRLYGITPEAIETVIQRSEARVRDDRGNTRVLGDTADGRTILVVIAGDDPEFVITVFLRS